MFQTYVRTRAGIWRKWDAKPTNLAETRASLKEAREVLFKPYHVMGKRFGVEYTHLCAIPMGWSFA